MYSGESIQNLGLANAVCLSFSGATSTNLLATPTTKERREIILASLAAAI
jgi:hypothetical protein